MTRSFAVVGAAAHDDVDVRVVGVPVIDADPVEFRAEVLLHLSHEVARERLQVGHLRGVLGRDDEPEMMPVVLASLGERLHVGVVGLGTEHARLLAVARHALAAQIIEMCPSVARRAVLRTIRVLTVARRERLTSAVGWPARWRRGRGRSGKRAAR